MPRMWLLAIRSWSASPVRTLASLMAVALGVSIVVALGNLHETARLAIEHEVKMHWLGSSHVTVHPLGAHWGSLPAEATHALEVLPEVKELSFRLKRRMLAGPTVPSDAPVPVGSIAAFQEIDAIGVRLSNVRQFIDFPSLEGKLPDNRNAEGETAQVVMERALAQDIGVTLDSRCSIAELGGRGPHTVQVVGLFDGRRIGDVQRPYVYMGIGDLQEIAGTGEVVSAIDIILHNASEEGYAQGAAAAEQALATAGLSTQSRVETATFQRTLLGEARRLTQLSMTLGAMISMLSAFFIILTTMSMSLFQRIQQLGVMRCVGMTRGQMAQLVVLELLPIGILGTGAGLLLGLGLTELIGLFLKGEGIELRINAGGLLLAAIAGISTTAFTIVFLTAQLGLVTPLSALHLQARPYHSRYLVIPGVAGIVLLLVHEWIMLQPDQTRWLTAGFAYAGVGSVYLGYILLTPLLVLVLGPLIARLVGPLLGLPSRLAVDQFGRGPWRSTGVCWMLVVGLSLIVYISVSTESQLRVWNFAGRLPTGFIWTGEYVERALAEQSLLREVVDKPTMIADVDCRISLKGREKKIQERLFGALLDKLSRPVFVGCEPQRLMNMVEVTFD